MSSIPQSHRLVSGKMLGLVLFTVCIICGVTLTCCNCQYSVLPDGSESEQSSDAGRDAGAITPELTRPDQRETPEQTLPPEARLPEQLPDVDLAKILTPAAASDHQFATSYFRGSQACAFCHNGISDKQGNDVSIEAHWSSTMMANASRDPLWRAKFLTEIARQPTHSTLIQDKCTRCHAPMANTEQHLSGQTISAVGQGFLNSKHQLYDAAMEGVSCTLCHQIKPGANWGKPEGASGHYEIDASRKIYGPYTDPFTNPMQMNVNYTPTYSAHVSSSKLCASCHDLKTPFVDKSGTLIPKDSKSEFPEQMVYSEWSHSDYRDGGKTPQSCQQCHMARASDVVIATRPPWLDPRPTFAKHIFVGANVLMLTMLRDNRQLLGISADQFELTIQETKKMLQSSASLDIIEPQRQAGALVFKVKVSNLSGHKLPSGYPSRRVFLHTTVRDAAGKIIFESGKVGAQGQIMGLKSEVDHRTYEPHHQEINDPSQVQIYEPVMKNVEGEVTHTLLRAAFYAKDNRLLPRGFDKATAADDVKVRGNAIGDADFVGGSDITLYRIANAGAGTLTIQVQLMYQTVSFPFVQDLFRNQEILEVQRFQYMWRKAPSYAELITSRELKF